MIKICSVGTKVEKCSSKPRARLRRDTGSLLLKATIQNNTKILDMVDVISLPFAFLKLAKA